MESKNLYLFSFAITTIIVGLLLFKRFDFENFRFEKPAIAIIYIIGFFISLYFLIMNSKERSEK